MRVKSTHTGKTKELNLIVLLSLGMLLLFVFSVFVKHKKPSAEETIVVSSVAPQTADFKRTQLELSINKEGYNKISQKRNEALKLGLLFSTKDDFVDADIKIDGEEYACKVRLKGDLLDHLHGKTWSFRIILKDGKEWRGMKTFSIHNSKARSHTAEWLMHELFRQEGIIVPDYDFIDVKVNGVSRGIYAYEHHFENQMLKRNQREIGPILKHNDDAYWDNVQADLKPFPWIEASSIDVFNDSNISNPAFGEMAKRSIGMLNDFLEEQKSVEEVFDLDLMAKYFALLDLSHAWHAQQFTNIRFYHNPTTGKLEPIAYDCFGDHLPAVNKDWEALGEGFNSGMTKKQVYERANVYRYHLLQDEGFFTLYMKYLQQFTNPSYLNDFKKKMSSSIDARATFIKSDEKYKDFNPNFDKLFSKAVFTNKKILPKSNLSLKAYRVNDSRQEIALQSFHYFPMEVLGFGSEVTMTETLDKPMFLEAYNPKIPMQSYKVKALQPIEYIYYRTLGTPEVFKLKLPKTNIPELELATAKPNMASLLSLPFVKQAGNQITIGSGVHTLDSDYVIAEGYEVQISAGTILNFVGGASLCSYSPIKALGSKEQPIVFKANGEQGTGILLSNIKEPSRFEYCQFLNFEEYKHLNILTQAGVSVYKSEVDFNHCSFSGFNSKESLNVRNAIVKLRSSNVINSRGTAIKSSYSNLNINQVELASMGRNGIHLVAGNCEANNLVVRDALNKALNFTENTKVYMNKVDVYNCFQSFYANDHSKVTMVRFWNQDIKNGIEVRSNHEPHTKVEFSQFNHKDVETLFLIKQGLSVMVNGKKEKG